MIEGMLRATSHNECSMKAHGGAAYSARIDTSTIDEIGWDNRLASRSVLSQREVFHGLSLQTNTTWGLVVDDDRY